MSTTTNLHFEYKGNETAENNVFIDLCSAKIEELFRDALGGLCPVCCACEINEDEIVCGDCFDKALMFRCQGPPLPDTH